MGRRRTERTRATETHVGLLRGIHVGGRNRIPMARLVDIFSPGMPSEKTRNAVITQGLSLIERATAAGVR